MFVPNKAFLSLVFAFVTIGPTFVDADELKVDMWGADKVPCISSLNPQPSLELNRNRNSDYIFGYQFPDLEEVGVTMWDGEGDICSKNELNRAFADGIMLVYSMGSETTGGFQDLPDYIEELKRCGGSRPVMMVGVTCPWDYFWRNKVTLDEAAEVGMENNIQLFLDQVSPPWFFFGSTQEKLEETFYEPMEDFKTVLTSSSTASP